MVKNPCANAGYAGSVPGREGPLEKGTATHSGIPAWDIPWTDEPGGLQFTGKQRVRRDGVSTAQCTIKLRLYWSQSVRYARASGLKM